MSTKTKIRAVDTKKLSRAVADFIKLYNIDLLTGIATINKKTAEKELIKMILEEANKYEE